MVAHVFLHGLSGIKQGKGAPEAPKPHTPTHVHEARWPPSAGPQAPEPWEAMGQAGRLCSVSPGGRAIQCLTPQARGGWSAPLPAGRMAMVRFPGECVEGKTGVAEASRKRGSSAPTASTLGSSELVQKLDVQTARIPP